MPTTARALRIHPLDNVAVSLEDISAGSGVEVAMGTSAKRMAVLEDIPFAHKFAIKAIADGETIVKYGAPVGRATAAIEVGAWVHTHNAQSRYVRPAERAS